MKHRGSSPQGKKQPTTSRYDSCENFYTAQHLFHSIIPDHTTVWCIKLLHCSQTYSKLLYLFQTSAPYHHRTWALHQRWPYPRLLAPNLLFPKNVFSQMTLSHPAGSLAAADWLWYQELQLILLVVMPANEFVIQEPQPWPLTGPPLQLQWQPPLLLSYCYCICNRTHCKLAKTKQKGKQCGAMQAVLLKREQGSHYGKPPP